ncbi:histidine kinase [Streptomyces sp. RerS4]|uniref:sensor histidine kinase n=1 Tax=Streptomyces sp. RerS4 TaxID=2942449 RepID=UPI0032E357DE
MPVIRRLRRFAPGRAAGETVGVALAGLGVYAAIGWIGALTHPWAQLALLAAGVGLFPLRRRLPAAVPAALAALTGVAPALGPVTAATAYAVARRSVGARLPAGAGAALVAAATVAGPWFGPGSVAYGLALGLVLAPTAVIVPGLVGTAQGQQARLVRALRERGDAAERARRLAESESRMHERSRIAAEMHDLVGHRLSLVSLHAGGLELALEKAAPELREEAVLVRRTARDAMRELRQALGVLGPLGRDTGPDTLTDATGTRADVEALIAHSRDGGVAVRLDWSGSDLDARPAPVRRAVHRVVREALTNVHRYAADAHVTVAVVHDAEAVRVTVRNGAPLRSCLVDHAGSGSAGRREPGMIHKARPKPRPTAGEVLAAGEAIGTGRGLAGLRERVELLGGTLEAAALPSGGFRVEAVVPAEPAGDGVRDRDGVPDGRPEAAPDLLPGRPLGPAPPARRTAEALTLGCGLLTLCVLMVLGVAFVYAAQPSGVRTGPAPLPRIGMTYQDVAATGVLDNKAVRAAATGHEPPRPAGTAGCVYPFNGATEPGPDGLIVARYCFDAAQRLIAIDRFTVPSVRDGTPWETP